MWGPPLPVFALGPKMVKSTPAVKSNSVIIFLRPMLYMIVIPCLTFQAIHSPHQQGQYHVATSCSKKKKGLISSFGWKQDEIVMTVKSALLV